MLAPRRLPGIRIDVAPPPVAEALPRMDVAVFAGFASTGPLHVPVLITGVPHFAAVFGRDAPLVWDAERGERVYAHLGPSVRAFFANGGRRCWVIRVARSAALEAVRRGLNPASPELAVALSNRFPVAGVLEIAASGTSAAEAVARCEGSWSDELRLATALQQRTIGIVDFTITGNTCEFRARRRIETGELLELRDGELRVFAVAGAVAVETQEIDAPYHITATVCACFERLEAAPSPPIPLAGDVAGAAFETTAATLSLDTNDADAHRLSFTVAAPLAPRASQWLRFTSAGDVTWMQARSSTQRSIDSASPGGMLTHVEVDVFGPAWQQIDPLPAFAAPDRVFVSTLELRAENSEDSELARLNAVGLTPAAVNPWWQQASDEQVYRAVLETRPDTLAGPEEQVVRFPFAPRPGATPIAWIPLAVDALFNDGLGPLPDAATALERDGLADFDASLFLDPELAALTTDEVTPRAESIRFLRDVPRALFGVHAALGIGSGGLSGECSLLSVPDAVHLGWQRQATEDPPAPNPRATPSPAHWATHRGDCAPEVAAAMSEPDFGVFLDCATRAIAAPILSGPIQAVTSTYQLLWTAVEPGAEYVLTEAQQADLGDERTIYTGDLTQHVIEPPRDGVYYYRVYARAGEERSDASNIVVVQVRQEQWQQRDAADFVHEEPELLRLQRALLRFAASSGELFVILSLPRHYRAPEAVRFAGRLRTFHGRATPGDTEGLALTETRTLSYGALYHPWLVCASTPPPNLAAGATAAPTRVLPPEGAIAGTFAARATLRGAWVAPANQALIGVVASTPEIEPDDWQALQDAAVNLVRDDARGFLTLSADTLADDPDLQLVNVRRLLTLLRRLALRRGTRYVFEPNGPVLRRAVQRGFDTLLADLFQRGAFAGRTRDQSFRVVTDDTVNTRIDADAGRFIVELRVAPSMPMRFLSVLLAQTGERLTVTEEL